MKRALTVVLLLALPAYAHDDSVDAGVQLSAAELLLPRTVRVDHARIVRPDGGVIDVVRGGWLCRDTLIEAAQRQAIDHEESEKLEQSTMTDPTTIAAISGALLAGVAVGFAIAKLTSSK